MPELTISDEARSVNFSWDFIWKTFLALLVISVISTIIGALGLLLMGDESHRGKMHTRLVGT